VCFYDVQVLLSKDCIERAKVIKGSITKIHNSPKPRDNIKYGGKHYICVYIVYKCMCVCFYAHLNIL
jgi:hypothetical protein